VAGGCRLDSVGLEAGADEQIAQPVVIQPGRIEPVAGADCDMQLASDR